MGVTSGANTGIDSDAVMAYDYRSPTRYIGRDLVGTEDGSGSGVVLQSNGSLYFDGVNDRVSYNGFTSAEHFVTNSDLTIMSFVNVKSYPDGSGQPGRSSVFSCQRYRTEPSNGGFSLATDALGTHATGYNLSWVQQFGYEPDGITGNQTSTGSRMTTYGVDYNEIHCIGWTYTNSSKTIQWYRDGIEQNAEVNTNFNWTANSRTSPRALSGINTQGGWSNYLEMDLYTLFIWKKALTPREVQKHYYSIAPDLGLV